MTSTPTNAGASVLIVDDHAAFRSMARRVLTGGDFEVVGEAATGAQARAQIASQHPDVVLLDIALPDGDGIEIAAEIALLEDPPRVALTSSRPAVDHGARLAGAAACGFIAKHDFTAAGLQRLLG